MKFKKLVCCAIVTAMVASAVAGCGSNTNIEDTDVSETEVAEASETEETETEAIVSEESEEPETESESEDVTETETTEESAAGQETKNENDTEANISAEGNKDDTKAETPKVVEEKPVHTHSWDGGTVTTSATCTNNGVKTYQCSCGQTKTEDIAATGHNWVAQTTVVHHDAEGMSQQVQTGTQRTYYCNCGEVFYSDADRRAHDPNNFHGYSVWDEPAYETQWVETSPAWDETVTTGYICSICGATQ